jgi:hypothetical protein
MPRIPPTIEKRLEAITARVAPKGWRQVIVDEADAEQALAEHERNWPDFNLVLIRIVDPDPATHVAGAAILSPTPKPQPTGHSGIVEWPGPRERRLALVKPDEDGK